MTEANHNVADWLWCERQFIEADKHKPEEKRFNGWSESQTQAFEQWGSPEVDNVMLLFYPTGQGKSKTALALVHVAGFSEVVVIAPRATHNSWQADALALNMKVRVDTPQRFRMPATKYPAGVPIIYDEVHQAGGHTGDGWKKLNRMAFKMTVPLIMNSATPNYNDHERVFCMTAIGDKEPVRNFLDWVVKNCITRPNPFSMIPYVDGFLHYPSALEFLRSRPWVAYVEDTATWKEVSLTLPTPTDWVFTTLFEEAGASQRHLRMVASDMEKRHKRVELRFIGDDGLIRPEILNAMFRSMHVNEGNSSKQWMIYCSHKSVAEALYHTFESYEVGSEYWIITGDTSEDDVENFKQMFIQSDHGLLIGTSAIATGMDGVDKTCHHMLILDDIVGDNALRRQLIGRILPRGVDDDDERVVVRATFE